MKCKVRKIETTDYIDEERRMKEQKRKIARLEGECDAAEANMRKILEQPAMQKLLKALRAQNEKQRTAAREDQDGTSESHQLD